jgi:hypothetical protein
MQKHKLDHLPFLDGSVDDLDDPEQQKQAMEQLQIVPSPENII